jgi:hypothetical protein
MSAIEKNSKEVFTSALVALRKGLEKSDEIFVPMLSTQVKDHVQGNICDQIYGGLGIKPIQERHLILLCHI